MELTSRADMMFNLPDGSALDQDDLNGPGLGKFPRKTGDLSTDFALFKITQYAISSSITERIKFTRGLTEILLQLGKSSKEALFGIFDKIIEDQPEVRTEFALQLSGIATVLIKDMDSYQDVTTEIIPNLDRLLCDGNPEVVKAACEAAIELTPIVNKDERGSMILTHVLRLTHDEDEENKLKGLAALKEIIPHLNAEVSEHFVVPDIMALSQDSIVKIRKLVAFCIPKLARQVQEPAYLERLLKVYLSLSNDPIWGVRKCCVEGFATMIQAYNEQTQIQVLQPRFLELLKDKSNSVKQAALLQLGEIIAYSKAPLPETFLDQFTALSQNSNNKGEYQHHCAYYLPGILQIIGPDAWNTLVHPYLHMCSEGENMTKKCIAASIHEIAKIIGYENATNELVPIYQGMFLDNSPSKNIALENLTNFLRCIKEESRTVFLQYIKKAAKNTGNWRARFMIAKQLESLVDLYPTSVILGDLWQVILDLCGDRVAKIRDVAASALGKAGLLILTTGNNTNVILAIKQLVTDQTYTVRLIFAQAAIYLIQIPDFESLFGDELSQIAIDSVVNIRISCALAIKKGLKKNPGNEYWVSLFNKLTHDFDADVRSNITGKYEDNRGVSVLRPAPKQPPSLTPPILRQITADSDIGEIISFNLAGTNLVFEVLKDPIRPDWNGVVADLRIYSATIQELLIEC